MSEIPKDPRVSRRPRASEQSKFEIRRSKILQRFSLKGGDPAAGSPTATLLRLHPSYRSLLGDLPPLRVSSATSGAINFHGVTGGVYKARERIHPCHADQGLLAIPPSWSRVADSNPY